MYFIIIKKILNYLLTYLNLFMGYFCVGIFFINFFLQILEMMNFLEAGKKWKMEKSGKYIFSIVEIKSGKY